MLDRIPNPPAGMLRRCSPIWRDGKRCVVAYDPIIWVADDVTSTALDLTDPTGRAHLAAWIQQKWAEAANKDIWQIIDFVSDDEGVVVKDALFYRDMTPTEINTLARLALRMMGRAECAP